MSRPRVYLVASRSRAVVEAFAWPRVTPAIEVTSHALLSPHADEGLFRLGRIDGNVLREHGVLSEGQQRFSLVQTVWQGGRAAKEEATIAAAASGGAGASSPRKRKARGGAFPNRRTPGAMPCATTSNLFVNDAGRWRIVAACEIARAMGWSEAAIRVLCDAARAHVDKDGKAAPLADSAVRAMLGGALAVGVVADILASLAGALRAEA